MNDLPADVRQTLAAFCQSLEKELGPDLSSITLYGSAARGQFAPGRSDLNLLVVGKGFDAAALERLRPAVARGRAKGITPVWINEVELKASTDVFPTRFMSMKQRYVVLAGKDVLAQIAVSGAHLRLRLEQEMMNLLLRLRRRYLEQDAPELSSTLARAVVRLLENLRLLLGLCGSHVQPEDVIATAAKAMGFSAEALVRIAALRLTDRVVGQDEARALCADFIEIVRAAARFADALEEAPATEG